MHSQILKLICEAKSEQEIREAIKNFDEKNDLVLPNKDALSIEL